MKIAIVGYGKMGRTIELIAVKQGHEIVLRIDKNNEEDLNAENLKQADVAIEFTSPHSAYRNIITCLEAGIPVISGTTAWLDKLPNVLEVCETTKGAFLYASNYSIGVNIFFELNKKLAQMMNAQPQYEPKMVEIHHTQKLDAPSGTGITLAEGIIEHIDAKTHWVNETVEKADALELLSERIDDVPGTHIIRYESQIDDIEIKHTAHTREGFAKGAVLAAQWIIGKTGFYGMKDVLDL